MIPAEQANAPASSNGRQTFPRTHRIRGRAAFEQVFRRRCSASDRLLVIYVDANGLSHPRLGLVVGRKLGDAVRRNRIKRLVREAFRLSRPDLPSGYDLVCVPRGGEKLTLNDYQNSLRRVTARAVARFEQSR